jgi:uncharacterized protein DUF4232
MKPGKGHTTSPARNSPAIALLVWSLASLAAGCAGGPPPTPTPQPSAPSGPGACANEDLDVAPGGWDGATGQVFGFVIFRNRSGRPCELFGFPGLELRDGDGQLLARPTSRFDVSRVEPVVLLPGAAPIAFVPDRSPPVADGTRPGQAILPFLFGNLCRPAPREVTIVLTLPGQNVPLQVATLLPSPPRCDAPGSPPSLAVGAFEPPSL